MRWLFGHAFCGVLPAFLAHWSRADLVECLNDYAVLSVGLEIRDLQVMLLYVFLGEIDGLEHIRLVRRLSVSNVVAENLTIPVFARRWFPCYLMAFTLHVIYIYREAITTQLFYSLP